MKICGTKKLGRSYFGIFALSVLMLLGFSFTDYGAMTDAGRLSVALSAEKREVNASLPPELGEILEELEGLLPEGVSADPKELSESVGIERIFEGIISAVSEKGGDVSSLIAKLLGAALIFAIGELALEGVGELSAAVCSGINTVLAIPLFSSLFSLVKTVEEGLSAAGELFGGLIPLIGGTLSAGGLIGTAAAQSSGMSVTLGIISGLLVELLLPLVSAMFLLCAVTAFGNGDTPSGVGGVKGLFTFLMGAMTTVILGTLTLQTVITSAADSVTMRSVKYAISNMLPGVGSVVAGSLSTLGSGVGYLTGIVGGASVAAMCSLFAAPLILLLLHRLALRVALTVLEFLGASAGKRVLSSFLGAADALITVTACCGVIYILEIVLFIRHGVGVV